MNYYIEISTVNKAKQDIDEICRQEGYCNLTRCNLGKGGVARFMTKLLSVAGIAVKLKKGDTLFLQYPMKKFYFIACSLAHLKGAKVVTVIHDLGAFRRHKLTPEQENRRLSKTDFLIVHNPTMRDYLLRHGYRGGIHCLQIFDYLAPTPVKTADGGPGTPWRIVYAGNLARWRNDFLYRLDKLSDGWQMDLYGKGFNEEDAANARLRYHGFMASDDFIAKVNADFGLVWDGSSTEECTGDWGEYLRINDPHKTSFYLRAGIPVIVWNQAAMAPFIEKEKIGLVINSINELSEVLALLKPDDYAAMRRNAVAMGRRLADGYYVKQGMKAAQDYFDKAE